MKNKVTIQARSFPVIVQDRRTGEVSKDSIVLDKSQLQAAQVVGQSSKELIQRIYNRQGYKVLEVGIPTKREITIDLSTVFEGEEAK